MRTAIFIDGAYLDKLCQHEFGGIWLDFSQVPGALAGGQELLRTYYYDCPPYQSTPPTDEERRQVAGKDRFFAVLGALPRFQVRKGKLALRGNDQNGRPIFVQKRIDIMIGVDMVKLAATQQINRAVLVAGDSDFVPAVEEVKQLGVLTVLWHGPANHFHRELWGACDDRYPIDQAFIDRVRRNDR